MQGYEIQQSSTAYPLVFLLISSSDHLTGLTGLGAAVTVTISKSGAAFGAPLGAITEIGSGWYKVAGNATDTATLGPLALHAFGTGSDPSDWIYPIVANNPQDGVHFGLTALPNTACTTNASLLTSGAGTDQLSVAAGKVLLQATQTGVTIPTVTTVGTLTTYTGNTPQTGDAYVRLGAPAGASVSADIAAVKSDTGAILTDTVTILTDVNTGAGAIFTRLGAPAGASMSADIASVKASVGSVTGSVGSIAGITFPANFNDLSIDGSGFVQLHYAQAVPTSNTAQTLGDCLNAGRVQAFGAWSLVGTTLTLKNSDGSTARTFTLDSGTAPTQRS